MRMLSRLQPDSATSVGILTAIGVYLIYTNSPPDNHDVERARRGAAWKSAALITLVFVVARDLNSYIISGGALFGLDYMYKHHNMIQPATGRLETGGPPTLLQQGGEYPLPEQ